MATRSGILIVTLGSMNQLTGGTSDYLEHDSISTQLPAEAKTLLFERRAKALTWLQQDQTTKFQGILLSQHEYNKNVMRGKDFGGDDKRAKYLPALNRFQGRFYLTLGDEGKKRLFQTHHHVLFVCGLYGLMTAMEPLQLYNCPVEEGLENFRIWTKDASMTKILLAYIRQHGIVRVFDLTATEPRRNLIDWSVIHEELEGKVLHCFSKVAAGDDALIGFGKLMRNFLLDAPAGKLLSIKHETEEGDIVFRDTTHPRLDMPSEEFRKIMQQAESEFPQLPAYPIESAHELFTSGQSAKIREVRSNVNVHGDWLFSFTSEFQKSVFDMNDKKFQGRILEALTKLCKKPMERQGDTIKPLEGELAGKWRYRIGDYRMIYFPDEKKHTVFLLIICPRGSCYDE